MVHFCYCIADQLGGPLSQDSASRKLRPSADARARVALNPYPLRERYGCSNPRAKPDPVHAFKGARPSIEEILACIPHVVQVVIVVDGGFVLLQLKATAREAVGEWWVPGVNLAPGELWDIAVVRALAIDLCLTERHGAPMRYLGLQESAERITGWFGVDFRGRAFPGQIPPTEEIVGLCVFAQDALPEGIPASLRKAIEQASEHFPT